jgi:hypothetical protein
MNILDIITEVDLKQKGNTPEYSGPCPKCGGIDRFIVRVDKDYCWCRKCNYWANADKYAHDFNKTIENYDIKPIARKFVPPTPARPVEHIGTRFKLVETKNYIEYFGRFGINENTLIYFGVLDAVEHPQERFYRGYYIPNFSWWGPYQDSFVVCGGAYRVDPNCHMDWPKYLNEKGQKSPGYYHNYLLSTPDNKRLGPFLDHCFIVESQKDVMLLTQMGYNAVAFKGDSAWLYYSDTIFQRVICPIIIADNDGGAGLNIALRVQNGIKRGTIVSIDEAKQISDLVEIRGYDYALQYMKERFSWVQKGLVQI